MKIALLRGSTLVLGVLATSPFVHAHPGHDGHELTWDFTHLAAHPGATLGCGLAMISIGLGGWWLLRRSGVIGKART